MKLIKDICCSECNKIIGKYDNETNEILEMTDEYNTCDRCSIEICEQCTKVHRYTIVIGDLSSRRSFCRETQCCSKCFDKWKEGDKR